MMIFNLIFIGVSLALSLPFFHKLLTIFVVCDAVDLFVDALGETGRAQFFTITV